MNFTLGSNVETGVPYDFEFELEAVLTKKLLVQAMSGAGKSWLIRRLLEQVFGQCQIIVLDSEGDFKTLREKYPYVLVGGDDGDIPVTLDLAKPLALELLKLNQSAIIDISMLEVGRKENERCDFVSEFLTAMLRSPQKLWHPVLVVLDEAQEFAPERFSASSTEAVIQMAGQARKRGFGLILATNRLSELSKSAAAHCKSKLIGGSMGIDAGKAAFELGFKPKDAERLEQLEDGQFFARGPAFERGTHLVKIGPVETTHPSPSGRGLIAVPPPLPEVEYALSELAKMIATKPDDKVEPPISVSKKAEEYATKLAQDLADRVASLTQENQTLMDHQKRMAEELTTLRQDASNFQTIRSLLGGQVVVDGQSPAIDMQEIIRQVQASLPAMNGQVVQVTPPEALRKKYLEQAVEEFYAQIAALGNSERRVMEVLLSADRFWNTRAITQVGWNSVSGGQQSNVSKYIKNVVSAGLAIKGGGGRSETKAAVEAGVRAELSAHNPTDQEVQAVVQNVLAKVVTG